MIVPSLFFAALLSTNAVGTVAANRAGTNSAPVRITSDRTYYDRKEGLAIFKGHVHVDDAEYQLHAAHAYVFLDASNALSRISASGSVALTNGAKRAYGTKATYQRRDGLVVLHGDAERSAEVVDETEDGPRTVVGSKIRFWINSERVAVDESVLTAPRRPGDAKEVLALPEEKKK